jgi:hypothetical protein
MDSNVKYRGYTIRIEQDDDSVNPRTDFDHLGTMACWHRRYELGDKNNLGSPKEVMAYIEETRAVWLPVFMLDHSGLYFRTSDFQDPWDSGQVGYIFIERKKLLKEFGRKVLTKKLRQKAEEILRAEVEEYNDFHTGNVWGYTIVDPDGEEGDSCWGFYGDPEKSALLEYAQNSVDYCIRQKTKQHLEQLKTWIRNRVPLTIRQPFCLS